MRAYAFLFIAMACGLIGRFIAAPYIPAYKLSEYELVSLGSLPFTALFMYALAFVNFVASGYFLIKERDK